MMALNVRCVREVNELLRLIPQPHGGEYGYGRTVVELGTASVEEAVVMLA